MNSTSSHARAQRALVDSALALAAACAALVMFLPPLGHDTLHSVVRTVLTGLVVAVAMLLHWAFLGIGAKRMGLRVVPWVALALLLFPVGGAAALILLVWFLQERQVQPTALAR